MADLRSDTTIGNSIMRDRNFYYGTDAGSTDTYVISLTPAPTEYSVGMEVTFLAATANTDACTININSLGAKTIKKAVSTDLSTNDILAGQIVKIVYDGTNFQLI